VTTLKKTFLLSAFFSLVLLLTSNILGHIKALLWQWFCGIYIYNNPAPTARFTFVRNTKVVKMPYGKLRLRGFMAAVNTHQNLFKLLVSSLNIRNIWLNVWK
jgi:hypothetical protein